MKERKEGKGWDDSPAGTGCHRCGGESDMLLDDREEHPDLKEYTVVWYRCRSCKEIFPRVITRESK